MRLSSVLSIALLSQLTLAQPKHNLSSQSSSSSSFSSPSLSSQTSTSVSTASSITCPIDTIIIRTVTASSTTTIYLTVSSNSLSKLPFSSSGSLTVTRSSYISSPSLSVTALSGIITKTRKHRKTKTTVSSPVSTSSFLSSGVLVSTSRSLTSHSTSSSQSTMPTSLRLNTNTHQTQTQTSSPATTTTTISAPSSNPNPTSPLCGLQGEPSGSYFAAEIGYAPADVPVSLESCYQLCAGIYGYDMGCESYEFWPQPGTGAPRCTLYGASVENTLQSVDDDVPNYFYDIGCGNPADQ